MTKTWSLLGLFLAALVSAQLAGCGDSTSSTGGAGGTTTSSGGAGGTGGSN